MLAQVRAAHPVARVAAWPGGGGARWPCAGERAAPAHHGNTHACGGTRTALSLIAPSIILCSHGSWQQQDSRILGRRAAGCTAAMMSGAGLTRDRRNTPSRPQRAEQRARRVAERSDCGESGRARISTRRSAGARGTHGPGTWRRQSRKSQILVKGRSTRMRPREALRSRPRGGNPRVRTHDGEILAPARPRCAQRTHRAASNSSKVPHFIDAPGLGAWASFCARTPRHDKALHSAVPQRRPDP